MSSIYNGRSSILKNLCLKLTHKSIKTQLIEHRIEWKVVIITMIEMSGRKRKQLTLLLLGGIFYSIYYATWQNLKEIMNII